MSAVNPTQPYLFAFLKCFSDTFTYDLDHLIFSSKKASPLPAPKKNYLKLKKKDVTLNVIWASETLRRWERGRESERKKRKGDRERRG